MKFLCTVWLDGTKLDALPEAEKRAVDQENMDHDAALMASGHLLVAQALQSPETAVTLRMHDGKVSVTDGPFVEVKEHLGGFLLIEARDRDEAVEIARKVPILKFGPIEVRPIYIVPGSNDDR